MIGFLRFLATSLHCLTFDGLVKMMQRMWSVDSSANPTLTSPGGEYASLCSIMTEECGLNISVPISVAPPNHLFGLIHWRNLIMLVELLSPVDRLLAMTVTGRSDHHGSCFNSDDCAVDPVNPWVVDAHFHLDRLLEKTNLTSWPVFYIDYVVPKGTPKYCLSRAVASYAFPRFWPSTGQVKIISGNNDLLLCFGIHPSQPLQRRHLTQLKELLETPGVVAVGECGLDYTRLQRTTKSNQQDLFQEQLVMAREYQLPVVIHCRGVSGDSCSEDCLQLMQLELDASSRVYRHCFNGGMQEAQDWKQAFPNIVFGLSPVGLSNSRHPELDMVIRSLSLDELVLESDSPMMAFRSAQTGLSVGHPWALAPIIEKVAALKGVSFMTVCDATRRSAERLFCKY